MTYRVEATIAVDVTNAAAIQAIAATAGAGGGDERSQVQAAANAGLEELKLVVRRYGLDISDASLTVTESS